MVIDTRMFEATLRLNMTLMQSGPKANEWIFRMEGDTLLPKLTSSSNYILKLMSRTNQVIVWCLPGLADFPRTLFDRRFLFWMFGGNEWIPSGQKVVATPITSVIFKRYIGSFGAEEIR